MAIDTSSPGITNGFHLVVDALKLNGLDIMYGVAGIPVTDLTRLAQAKGMRYIGFHHEQSAGYAAAIAGYLTQKPGICLTVSAPGFLNGMVALANATTNGFPMIQISGSSDRAIVDLQQGDYEELDQMNAAKPYAKAAYRVNRAEDIGIGLARAIRAAVSGRPGGVYLDLPASVLSATLDAETAADRWSAWSTRHRGSFLLQNKSSAPWSCWPKLSGRSSSSARVRRMRRRTLTFGHSSRRPGSLSCPCPWPRACCQTTTRNRLPQPDLTHWRRPMW